MYVRSLSTNTGIGSTIVHTECVPLSVSSGLCTARQTVCAVSTNCARIIRMTHVPLCGPIRRPSQQSMVQRRYCIVFSIAERGKQERLCINYTIVQKLFKDRNPTVVQPSMPFRQQGTEQHINTGRERGSRRQSPKLDRHTGRFQILERSC